MNVAIFTIVFLVVAVSDFGGFYTCVFKRKEQGAHLLGYCLGCAGVVTVFYLAGVRSTTQFWVSFNSSIAFCFIDAMLLFLLRFCYAMVDVDFQHGRWQAASLQVSRLVAIIDCVSLLANPFFNHAMTFVPTATHEVAHFIFIIQPAYVAHLAFCYALVVCCFGLLIYRAVATPALYRGMYLGVIGCVLFVVALNALYVFQTATHGIDYSVLFYSVLGYAMYVMVFFRGQRVAQERVSRLVMDYSTQPMLVFDYNNRLFFVNKRGWKLFPDVVVGERPTHLNEFIQTLQVNEALIAGKRKARFYWTTLAPTMVSYICDYQTLYDNAGKSMAHSFVFTNNTLGVDALTGFQTEQYFESHNAELSESEIQPITMVVADLNRLTLINNALGASEGDRAIALQANSMRQHLPNTTAYVRLRDAKLGAVVYGLKQSEIKDCLRVVNEDLARVSDFSIKLKMDYSVCPLHEGEDVVAASVRALSALRTRKLLDQESNRSATLDSLIQMLRECDTETEGHVRRTRALGDNLAYNLGLSDYERDQLSLLCLFHDVGKVGIPLNILNKPAPLNAEERAIMREHVQKGYRIARATAGLEIVAEQILHHHEHWDGSGYPDGLQYEAIPVLSRIISVVDSYDAMTSDRPYRAGISKAEACAELKRCSGTQFDPYIVDAFVRMLGMDGEASAAEGAEGKHTKAAGVAGGGAQRDGAHGAGAQGGSGQSKDPRRVTVAPGGASGAAQLDGDDIPPSKTVMVSPVRYTKYMVEGPDSTITKVDETFEALTGYTDYDVKHLKLTQNDLLFEDDREPYWAMVREKLATSSTGYFEHRIRRKDGTGRYVYCLGIVSEVDGKPVTTIIATDITDSLSMQQQVGIARNRAMMSLRRLEESIQLDPMTNLLNRAAFRKQCERELLNDTQRCVLLMMDLDDFKNYNDELGHPKGDELLVAFAEELAAVVGEGNLAGRMGGDEFACLLKFSVTTPLDELTRAVRGVWQRVDARMQKAEMPMSVSAGAVYATSLGVDFRELYSQADEVLYHAKKAGKNKLFTTWER